MSVIHILQVLIACKHTVLTIHDASHQITFDVCISHALLVDDSLGRSREVIPYHIQRILNLHDLIHGDRSARITLDAAFALASIQVATKFLGDNIR